MTTPPPFLIDTAAPVATYNGPDHEDAHEMFSSVKTVRAVKEEGTAGEGNTELKHAR